MISTGVSSSAKIRSDEAIAPCSMLNFSDRSLIGRKKRCEYLQERDECSQRQRSLPPPMSAAANPENQRRRQRADQLDRRDRTPRSRRSTGRWRRGACRSISSNAVEVALLSPIQLHGGHAGDALLQIGVDARNPGAHRPVRLAHIDAKPLRDQRDERQHRERHERQAPIHPDQHGHDADQREHVAEHRHDT